MSTNDRFDVVIVGAGVSGINAAYRFQEQTPDRTFTILEGREALGGTWDLFKFPGIRSDSDMQTYGFPFRAWTKDYSIAPKDEIVDYMKETAVMYGIDKKIQYKQKVQSANWSSKRQEWALSVDSAGTARKIQCKFLLFCTGYYDYENALPVSIPGIDDFKGPVLHPQWWPEDLDYTGKHMVIIGSGATAVTLLPSLAQKAAKVTQLQRSPSYVMPRPQIPGFNVTVRRWLPSNWAFSLIRFRNTVVGLMFYYYCMFLPGMARAFIRDANTNRLPKGYPVDPNFTPRYKPWEQRLCASPDGDYFDAIKAGKADVVTATIKQITDKTIFLSNGQELNPDIIVTATGLKVLIGGNVKLSVDDSPVQIPTKHMWLGTLIQDVPNVASLIGYTNASWTPGADAGVRLVIRLLKYMTSNNYTAAIPRVDESKPLQNRKILDLNSTYIEKAKGDMPKAGHRDPWQPRSFYYKDLYKGLYGDLNKEMQYLSGPA